MTKRKFIDENNVKPTVIIIISVVIGGYFMLSYFDVEFLIKLASSIFLFGIGLIIAYLWFILIDKKSN
jgi:hypothetical protein